jgi:hypothetical protein
MILPTDASREAQRAESALFDLGRIPPQVRSLAYAGGGTFSSGIALYQVASTDGLTRDPAELRAEVAAIPDPGDRAALEQHGARIMGAAGLTPATDVVELRTGAT